MSIDNDISDIIYRSHLTMSLLNQYRAGVGIAYYLNCIDCIGNSARCVTVQDCSGSLPDIIYCDVL